MKNVTITLEEDVARWAKVQAAQKDTSVSRMLGEMLKQRMQQENSYLLAMQQYLSRPARALKTAGKSYPRRDELHER